MVTGIEYKLSCMVCSDICFSFWYYLSIKLFNFIEKTPPDGVVDSMIFEIENHRISSYYDLHIKNFNSDELKFLIEYQYEIV